MALPNHPDVAYEFVKTLRDCGYTWVLVQEHTVERPENGHGPEKKHLPHRLVCTNSEGKTRGNHRADQDARLDTKLVAQMQPLYEARSLSRWELAGKSVPPLVTQIADGENGGVMMNEFPGKFQDEVREASGSDTPFMNGTEYLEYLFASGIKPSDLPVIQPIHQKKIWDKMKPGAGPQQARQGNRGVQEGGPSLPHGGWFLDTTFPGCAWLRQSDRPNGEDELAFQ